MPVCWPVLFKKEILPNMPDSFLLPGHKIKHSIAAPIRRPLKLLFVRFTIIRPVTSFPEPAGVGSAIVLHHLGLAPNLALAQQGGDPQLILSVAGGHFLVATECNGFGLITSGALVAILAGGIAGRRWWTIAALVPAGLLIGFAFNVLRILAISTTARYFPGHYDLLHEVAGTLALWGGLGLIGWIAWRPEPARA